MQIGYARVSTTDQNLDMQLDALKADGCTKIYKDIASGAKTARPGLDDALGALRKDDVLVVWKLDRVGRSLKHLVEVIHGLNERGVGFRVLSGAIDTTTSSGRLMFGIFASLAEFERDLIRERTHSGLAAARARGRLGGRPPKMTKEKLAEARRLMDQGFSGLEAAKSIGVSRATLYRWLTKPASHE